MPAKSGKASSEMSEQLLTAARTGPAGPQQGPRVRLPERPDAEVSVNP